MLSHNVMSFVKKIVKSGTPPPEDPIDKSAQNTPKIRQTLGIQEMRESRKSIFNDLQHLTLEEKNILQKVWQKEREFEQQSTRSNTPVELKQDYDSSSQSPAPNGPACRICRKCVDVDELFHTCNQCHQIICEDCSSYSCDQTQGWKCSFCRRRQGQDKLGNEPPPGSGMQRVPSVRRMEQKKAQKNDLSSPCIVKVGQALHDQAPRVSVSQHISSTISAMEKSRSAQNSIDQNTLKDQNHRKWYSCPGNSQEIPIKIKSRPSVKRQKSIDGMKENKQHWKSSQPSSPERRDQYKELYPSSETSDRRSSSESQMGVIQLPPPSPRSSSSSSKYFHHTEQSSSGSESSIEDYTNDKRRKPRRRSRIQRQKNYVDENEANHLKDNKIPSRKNSANILVNSAEAYAYREKKRSMIDMKSQSEKPLRHIASDAALYSRKFSSESSDISEMSGGGEYSNPNEGFLNEKLYKAAARRMSRRESDRPPSPVNYDSSPSADEGNLTRNEAKKTGSLDENQLYTSTNFRQSIPSVFVDSVGDKALGYHYEQFDGDFNRRSSTGRALPPIPGMLFPNHRTASTRSLDLPREEFERSERRASAPERENIKIVIDDVDSERKGSLPATKIEDLEDEHYITLVLSRDPEDPGARTRGFGVRVMGGKAGSDGKLHAYVSWTVPGGPADAVGLQPGDLIIRWNDVILDGLTYEEVNDVIDKSGNTAEIVVDFGKKGDMLFTKPKIAPKLVLAPELYKDLEHQPVSSPTRRKLPKTPDQLTQVPIHGEIGLQIWYDQDRNDLVVTLLGARGLKRRKASTGTLPRAYAKIRLLPHAGYGSMKTPIAEPNTDPEWSKTFVFPNITPNMILDKVLDISIWDHGPVSNNQFLGEIQLSLRKVDLQDCPDWYPLSFQPPSSHALLSPPHHAKNPSGAHQVAKRMISKSEEPHSYSIDIPPPENTEEDLEPGIVKSTSMDSNSLLHPDHAWERPSQDQLMPPPVYERKSSAPSLIYIQQNNLGGGLTPPNINNMPKSTPSSRRGSVLTSQDSLPDIFAAPLNKERSHSASFRVSRSADADSERSKWCYRIDCRAKNIPLD